MVRCKVSWASFLAPIRQVFARRPEPTFVEELISDAKLVASYGRYAGTFKDDSFFATLAEVDSLADPTLANPSVIRLQKLLNDGVGLVPFTTLAALKEGWRPHKVNFRTSTKTVFLVLLSIAMITVTGRLTYVYNKGVGIAQELETLEEIELRPTYNRLIRDLFQATQQADLAASTTEASAQAQAELARTAYFSAEGELSTLTDRVSRAYLRAGDYLNLEAQKPLGILQPTRCFFSHRLASLRAWWSGQEAAEPGPWFKARCEPVSYGSLAGAARNQTGTGGRSYAQSTGDCAAEAEAQLARMASTGVASLSDYQNMITLTATRLACKGIIQFPPNRFPSTSAYLRIVEDKLSVYALFYLPALYGAMGAIMYHMRMILNPLRPNPPLVRFFHRVFLGALVGIMVSFLFTPESRLGSEVATIGFTSFVLAFLFGFSLNIFFTSLDHFVNVVEAGVRKWGRRSEDPEVGPHRIGPDSSV